MGSACFRRGNRENLEFMEAFLEERGCAADIELVGSRCEEKCRNGPNLEINGRLYQEVDLPTLTALLTELVNKPSGE
jgi:NADH:ubiquinone oxidoreductase subunit E